LTCSVTFDLETENRLVYNHFVGGTVRSSRVDSTVEHNQQQH
jgi:hypothetical protein